MALDEIPVAEISTEGTYHDVEKEDAMSASTKDENGGVHYLDKVGIHTVIHTAALKDKSDSHITIWKAISMDIEG